MAPLLLLVLMECLTVPTDNTDLKASSLLVNLASHVTCHHGLSGQGHQLHVEHQPHQGKGIAGVLTESLGQVSAEINRGGLLQLCKLREMIMDHAPQNGLQNGPLNGPQLNGHQNHTGERNEE